MNVKDILLKISKEFQAVSTSAHLDAQILLSFTLKQPKSYLYAHPEHELNKQEIKLLELYVKERLQGKPIAYITGFHEFWSLPFKVTSDVLIPRPETEQLVELTLELLPKSGQNVADLGTGSGAIICALAKERPNWHCYATDISKQALAIAADNANSLKLKNIEFFHGHWCQALPKIEFDAIVSNPPYISSDDPAIEEQVKKYEPKDALIAAENGLKAIKIIATDARSYLKKNGRLILEHGYQQKAAIYQLLTTLNFHDIKCYQDLAAKDRLTIAKF